MAYRRKIQNKVNLLIKQSGELTYRTSIVYLERYCAALRYFAGYDDFNTAVDMYLEQFSKVEDLKQAKIEEYFNFIIQEFFPGMINYDLFSYLKGEGLYFIYNGDDEIIYIGRTANHLDKRPLQSFICKFPLGATYLKIIPTDNTELFEAVLIDYNLPIYNSRKETFDIHHRGYTNIVKSGERILEEKDRLYPTSKKYDWVEDTRSIFDDVEDTI